MKYAVCGLLSLLLINVNGQEMNQVNQVVTALFVATDKHDWKVVENCFADNVNLDYSSMTGVPATSISSVEIIASWKNILPGFTHTHHQLGNFITTIDGHSAHVFCYGTATHYLEDEDGNVWTVVGGYDFTLKKIDKSWKIVSMTFNFKYQDGNSTLAAKAIENVKSK